MKSYSLSCERKSLQVKKTAAVLDKSHIEFLSHWREWYRMKSDCYINSVYLCLPKLYICRLIEGTIQTLEWRRKNSKYYQMNLLYDIPHTVVLDPKSYFSFTCVESTKMQKQIYTGVRTTGPMYTIVSSNAKKYSAQMFGLCEVCWSLAILRSH